MTEKHSPLPWKIEGPDMFGDYNILHPTEAAAIGAVVSNLRPPEEVAANAALIVRAVNGLPEVIAALEEIISANDDFRAGMPEGWEGDPLQDACDKARATLTKLKG